jgi:digalactosyldiacylglycerol synthase
MIATTRVLIMFILSGILFSCAKIQDPWRELWSRSFGKQDAVIVGGTDIVPESDLRSPERRIWIITTACLPWLTGTSVNPLLRAAYLAKDRPKGRITLLVPWLELEDQNIAFPPGIRFKNPSEQREYVQQWLIEDAQLPVAAERLNIMFYTARYHDEFHSIFPMGDMSALIPENEADVCILEEPEHLNWYRAPFTEKAWIDKFKHVIGIIHTNYLIYTRGYSGGHFKEPLLFYLNQGMCRANCHKIIKLSGALQEFAVEKEIISNVHGVREKYLTIGDNVQKAREFKKGAYFVGKLAWPKGINIMYTYIHTV